MRNGYIDGWRGISVLMVIANHFILFRFKGLLDIEKGTDLSQRLLAKAGWFISLWGVNAGMVGVCIFFVISGFLITSLMLKEEARASKVSLGMVCINAF